MRRVRQLLAVGVMLMAAGGVQAAEAGAEGAGALDLLALYQQAREHDPRILAAEAGARRGQAQQREALGRLLPQVSADVRLTRTHYRSMVAESRYNGERYALSMTQALYDAPVWQSYQRSRALSRQFESQGMYDIQGAAADLVQRYFNVLAAQDSLELIQAEKRAVERNLARIHSLYERQLAPVTDKLEMEARFDRLKSDEIEAENNIWIAREALAEVIGRPVYERLKRLPLRLEPGADFQLDEFSRWRDMALARNPLIQARLASVEAQRLALKEASGGHHPKVTLQLSSQKSNIGYENAASNSNESNVAAISIQLPIFSGGATGARVDAAYEGLLIAQQDLEAARRQVLREVRSAFMNAEAALARVEAGKVALLSATRAREAAEKSFTYGINNVVDVVDRAREELSARRDLLEAQYSFLLGYVMLKRWTGTLDEADILAINSLLGDRPGV